MLLVALRNIQLDYLARKKKSMAIRSLTVTIEGQAVPQGSKNAFLNKKTGRINLVESSKKLKPWRENASNEIRLRALEENWKLIPRNKPVSVSIVFGIKPPLKFVREFPTTIPDIDKLTRACLDSITQAGIVWEDDSQVIGLVVSKTYMARPKTEVKINAAFD